MKGYKDMLEEKDLTALMKAKKLCDDGGHTLLYLSKHGSHLYGTNVSTSDADYKGVFLPNISNIIMGYNFSTLTFNSKTDANKKNSSDDIDLQLFSIQFWLNKLVKDGETEGIELLYSCTNHYAVLYLDPCMVEVFNGRSKLFNPCDMKGFINFAISQSRKYFIKAERLLIIKNILNFLTSRKPVYKELDRVELVSDVIDEILEKYMHTQYCFEVKSNELRSIQICGKIHQETTSLDEFINRIKREYDKYGHRTRMAVNLDNKDWKSLSHAMKAIIEVKTLLKTGMLVYPLPEKNLLLSIKLGNIPYNEVENLINFGIEEVKYYISIFDNLNWKYQPAFVKQLLVNMYKVNLV